MSTRGCGISMAEVHKKAMTLGNTLKKNESVNREVALLAMIRALKATSEIKVNSEDVSLIAKTIFRAFTVLRLNNYESFKSEENIASIINKTLNPKISTPSSRDNSTDLLTSPELVRIESEASSQFINFAFGTARAAKIRMQKTTNQHLFDALFINRGSVPGAIGIVTNDSDLNKNIEVYLELLYLKIVAYYKNYYENNKTSKNAQTINNIITNSHLYNADGSVSQAWLRLQSIIKADFERSQSVMSDDELKRLYEGAINPKSETHNEDLLKLEAYNAIVLLNNFDNYIISMLGNVIDITHDFNVLTNTDKYKITQSTANLTKTWRDNDEIMVGDEIDLMTKLLINTTPKLAFGTNEVMGESYLEFSDFEYIVGKIKDLVYDLASLGVNFSLNWQLQNSSIWNSFTPELREFLNGKTLTLAINILRQSPVDYFHHLMELLTNLQFLNHHLKLKALFSEDELNKMWSLYKYIFNTKPDSDIQSIFLLTSSKLGANFYSYITQVADSIFKIKYLQYYKEDGVIKLRTLIDSNVAKVKANMNTAINVANNNNLTAYDDWVELYKLNMIHDDDGVLKGISFVIPNSSIQILVSIPSLSVLYFDLDAKSPIYNLSDAMQKNLKFLDDVLAFGLSTNRPLLDLLIKSDDESTVANNLFKFAAHTIVGKVLNQQAFDLGIRAGLMPTYLERIFGSDVKDLKFKYNYRLGLIDMVSNLDATILNLIANAKADILGIRTSSVVRDSELNAQSQQSLSRLLGSIRSQWDLLITSELHPMFGSLILQPGVLTGILTAKEYYDGDETKSVVNMSPAEMAYVAILEDYIGGMSKSDNKNSVIGNGKIAFLPSVNSDKTTIGRIVIDTNAIVNGKRIRDYNKQELNDLIKSEFGRFYTRMYQNIVQDWAKLDEWLNSPEGADYHLFNLGFSEDFKNGFKNINRLYEQFALKENTGKSLVEWIKGAVLEYNKSHRNQPLELVDLVHFKNVGGNLGINESIISQLFKFAPEIINKFEIGKLRTEIEFETGEELVIDPEEQVLDLSGYLTFDLFFAEKEKDILKTLLKSDFLLNTTDSSDPNIEALIKHYKSWINPSGDLIIAKVNGKAISKITDFDGIDDIYKYIDAVGTTVEINPILSRYNALDYLFTLEFMNSSVGSFVAHPDKSKSSDVSKLEASQFQALHKRNVSFTAAMHAFQLNLLNGIPEEYNLAVIEDIHDEQGVIVGKLNDISPFDGATFVNPFIVHLENYSLGGSKAGITKKQFVHFYNERTGTGGIIKTAGFGLTNDWVRNSPFLRKMFEKMTRGKWMNEDGSAFLMPDLLHDYNGDKIVYKDVLFEKDGVVYQKDLSTLQRLADGKYYCEYYNVENPNEKYHETVTINSNLTLWEFFGGSHSLEYNNEKHRYQWSENSILNVVTAMNSIGTVKGSGSIRSQRLLYQPLKHSDIHYLATAGAVKQGAANINSRAKYDDDEDYDFLKIHMYQAGIQLDKEHHADLSEISMMTLVISACAALGYTFEAATLLYNALKTGTEQGLFDYLKAINTYVTNAEEGNEAIREIIIEAVIKNLSTDSINADNFAGKIAQSVMDEARLGKKIKYAELKFPISDNTLYAKLTSIINVAITSSGIKQKIPGILSVLTPSFGIYKVFDGRKYESFKDPENDLKKLQAAKPNLLGHDYRLKDKYFMGLAVVDNPNAEEPYIGKTEMQVNMDAIEQLYTSGNYVGIFNLSKPFTDYADFVNFMLSLYMYKRYNGLKEGESDLEYALRATEAILRRMNSISRVELGRTYRITYDVFKDEEGKPIVVDVKGKQYYIPIDGTNTVESYSTLMPVDQGYVSKDVNTPLDYIALQELANEGLVSSIIEDVTVGRNLASYNVRFFSAEMEAFQLSDLDTFLRAYKLTQIDGIKDKGEKYKAFQDFIADYKVRMGYIVTLENIDDAVKDIRRKNQRLLQNDLKNLSSTPNEILSLWDDVVANFSDAFFDGNNWKLIDPKVRAEAIARLAYFVNISTGEGLGRSIRRANGLITDFNELLMMTPDNFRELMHEIRGRMEESTKVSIGGRKISVQRGTIEKSAYELIMPKTFMSNFDLDEFTDLNEILKDKDYFVKLAIRKQATTANPKSFDIELKRSNGKHYYILRSDHVTEDLKELPSIIKADLEEGTFRLNDKKEKMYELHDPEDKIYTDGVNEIIVAKDPMAYVENLHYDGIKLSSRLWRESTYLESLILRFDASENPKLLDYVEKVFGESENLFEAGRKNAELYTLRESDINLYPEHPLVLIGRLKYASFVKSLDIVAARIPSLSMQSFMPMRVVAFDNPNVNTAYVSTMQILLLGSDYRLHTVCEVTNTLLK